MRLMPLISAALVLVMSGSVFAQEEYQEFVSKDERFTITFPGKPVISETTWFSEYGAVLPARVYTISGISGKHTLTVVDYRPIERILLEKAKTCPPGAETCQGVGDTGTGYWKNDIRGAVTYAIGRLITERDVKVTHLMWNFMELVAGNEIQMTNLKDQSRTFAAAYMHDYRLLIAESTVPKGFPPPTVLQQSIGWLDENGRGIRYQYPYYNEPDPTVPRVPIRGRGAAPADRIDPGVAGVPPAR
jgi:hypothetical protein